jgi:hypothetical protein
MSSEMRYWLEKHKTRIAIAVASVVVLIILSVFIISLISHEEPVQEYVPNIKYASHYVMGQEDKVVLYDTAGKELDSISFDNIIYPNNRSDNMVLYADGEIIQITAEKSTSDFSEKTYFLDKETLVEIDAMNIIAFAYNDEYVVIQRGDNSFTVYNRTTKTTTNTTPMEGVSDFIIVGKNMIYAEGNNICTVNMLSEMKVSIDVGAETYGFSMIGDNVLAYNKFGNGKSTTTMFILNPETLYIEGVLTENTVNIFPVSNTEPLFMKKANTLVFAEIVEDNKLNSVTLNVKSGAAEFTPDNTICMNDYIYSIKDGNMIIISVNGKYIEHTINISGVAFCPAYLLTEE